MEEEKGGDVMQRRKQVLTVISIVWVIGISLTVLNVYAAWTPEDMADWMNNIGRHKIWGTHYIVKNEIKPAVEQIEAMLTGESYTHSFIFNTAETQEWIIPVFPAHPNAFSLWADITTMNEGDTITVTLIIDREGTGSYYIYWDGSAYSTWEWTADGDTRFHWLVVDQLAISNNWRVKMQISYAPVATPVTIHCEAIIEEV